MSTAMPLVKPVTTDTGMKRIHVPIWKRPIRNSITPAIIVQRSRLATPYCVDDAVDDDDESAGRPADLHARAAERRDEEAGDDRGVDAGLRRHARCDRECNRERQREHADSDARGEVGRELPARVAVHRVDEARPEAGDAEVRRRCGGGLSFAETRRVLDVIGCS